MVISPRVYSNQLSLLRSYRERVRWQSNACAVFSSQSAIPDTDIVMPLKMQDLPLRISEFPFAQAGLTTQLGAMPPGAAALATDVGHVMKSIRALISG